MAGDLVVKKPAGGRDRLRFSSWFDPNDLLVRVGKVPTQKKNRRGRMGPQLNTKTLLMRSGQVDDISLQRTLLNDEKMNVIWDTQFMPFLTADPKKFPKDAANAEQDRCDFFNHCMRVSHFWGIQFLVGYGMLKPGKLSPTASPADAALHKSETDKFNAFNDWIKQQNVQNPTIDVFAQRIVDFMDKNLAGCDGISFDLEGLSTGKPLENPDPTKMPPDVFQKTKDARLQEVERVSGNISQFYGALADKLLPRNMLVAVATAGLTSRTAINSGIITPDMFLLQQYDMAKGHPNILIRPMAYDNFTVNVNEDDPQILAWHQKIVEFALTQISNANFQLGIKTIPGTTFGGFITKEKFIRERCKSLLRADNGVGLILFPSSLSFWDGCNNALNPSAPSPGEFQKQPIQAPFDQQALDRLSGPADSILPANPVSPPDPSQPPDPPEPPDPFDPAIPPQPDDPDGPLRGHKSIPLII